MADESALKSLAVVRPLRPRGRAVRWATADLVRLSAATHADVAAAKEDFRRLAPRAVRDLLD